MSITRTPQVLVCDDDENFCEFLCALLRGEGWGTAAVQSGEECLERLAGGSSIDLLVLDHLMPGLLGLDVAEKLRGRGDRRPIVLCSAYVEPHHRVRVARLDLTQVNKINTQAVVRTVAALLASATEPYPERTSEERAGRPHRRQVW